MSHFKPLPYDRERWLAEKSKHAWSAYIHMKYGYNRSEIKTVIPEEIKEIIREAYK